MTTEPRKRGGQRQRRQEGHLLDLAGRLTERDRRLCRVLLEHRVLVPSQVADLGFSTVHKAQARLSILWHLEVVDRFRPRTRRGSAPFHYLLGPTGAALMAAEQDTTVAELGWRRDVGAALATSSRLTHLVGTNGFFTGLVAAARQQPGCELAEWRSERRCAALWGELVRPDGYGVWVEEGWSLPFLLEFDLGTERLARLEAKLPGYAALADAAGHPTWVLFCFPTRGREEAARQVLAHPRVPVATAVLEPGQRANERLWRPVGVSEPKTLAALGNARVRSTPASAG